MGLDQSKGRGAGPRRPYEAAALRLEDRVEQIEAAEERLESVGAEIERLQKARLEDEKVILEAFAGSALPVVMLARGKAVVVIGRGCDWGVSGVSVVPVTGPGSGP